MKSSSIILVDSDALIALRKTDDSNHEKSLLILKKLKTTNCTLLATNYVFSETITVLSQRISHINAVEFIEEKDNPSTFFTIIRLSEDIEELAIEIFKRQTSKNVSYVDCTNMALIETRQVDKIWSFDEIYKKNKCDTVS